MKAHPLLTTLSLALVLSACQSQPLASTHQPVLANAQAISDLCNRAEVIEMNPLAGRFEIKTQFKGNSQSGTLEVSVTLLAPPQTPPQSIQYTVQVGTKKSAPFAFSQSNPRTSVVMQNVTPSERVSLSYYAKLGEGHFRGGEREMSARICS